MKYWTIQTKDVIEIISKKGIYQPDFNKSNYLNINPDLEELYYFVLKAYNKINGVNLFGLIYAFAQSDGVDICQISDINEFSTFIKNKTDVIGSLLKTLIKRDVMAVELIYDEKFNPIYVDINDFQLLMPPVTCLHPYTEQSFDRIYNNISKGKITTSEFPSNVIQAHLPYIKQENIINTYPIFDI